MTRARTSTRKRPPAQRQRAEIAYLTRAVLCTMGGINEHQLSLWEFEELVAPAAVVDIDGSPQHVYDQAALTRIRTIRRLAEDLGVNLPGIEVILDLLERLDSR